MRVWIDITNSPHVLFFRPLIRLLQEDGHEVAVTAREYAQTLELLELHGIAHEVVGPRHGGAGAAGKARALAGRLTALRRFAKGRRFDRRPRPRLARAHADRPQPRDPERDGARLRVRLAPAPPRAPRRDSRRLSRRGPGGAARALRSKAAEARHLPRDQGGVLPRRLRARPGSSGGHRPGPRARDRAHAAGRVGLPPARQPALRAVLERLGRDESVHAVVLPRTAEQRDDDPRARAARRCTCPSTPSTRRASSRSPTSSSRREGR